MEGESVVKEKVVLEKMVEWFLKRVILTSGKKQQLVLSRGGKTTGKYSHYFNVQMNDSSKNLRCINFNDVTGEENRHFQLCGTSKCSYGAKAEAWRQRSCEGEVKTAT